MGSGGGVWDAEDTNSVARLNQKTVLVDTGANINSATAYAGMLAYCTSTGSGFSADVLYERNAANTAWSPVGGDQKPYLELSTTIGDYTQPSVGGATSTGGTPTFSDDFSGADAWTDNDSTKIGVDTTNDYLAFDAVADSSNDACVYDLGAGNVSDTMWTLRFKIRFSTLTATGDLGNLAIGISDSAQTTAYNAAQDFCGVLISYLSATKTYGSFDTNGAALNSVSEDATQSWTPSTGVDYFFEINRTSATGYNVKRYSDSTYAVVSDSVSGTVSSSTASLRYIKILNVIASGASELAGYIDDVKFFNATNPPYPANAVDDSTSTKWESASENNPAIYVDLASAREIVGIALNIDKTATTATSIKIRASTDTTFDDTENLAYLNVSDFTDDTWRFIATNFNSTNKRYVQVISNQNSSVLAINEIKVRYGVSDTVKILAHKHRTRNVSAADSFVDSN